MAKFIKMKKKKKIKYIPEDYEAEMKVIRLRWLSQGAAITAACRYLGTEFESFETKIPLVEVAFSFCEPNDNYSAQDGLQRAADRLEGFMDGGEFDFEDDLSEKGRQSVKRNCVRVAASSGEGKDIDRYVVAALRHMRHHHRLPTWLSNELKKQDKLARWAKPSLPSHIEKESLKEFQDMDAVSYLVHYSGHINAVYKKLEKEKNEGRSSNG